MKANLPNDLTIFNAALEITAPAERAAYINQACGSDAVLRQKILGLIEAYESDGDTFEHLGRAATVRCRPEVHDPARPGTVVGRYKLLQQIGEGGCGVVYMAEQEAPVKRRVALKIIKLGMDTKSVIGRFEAERQALALMDHPNIAKVLDAGSTENGRPYFVMELVRGTKITEYCDEKALSTQQRLELFTQVCQAIQHAHQKGIIHRDVKPSNVLVTVNDGVAVPKVIDFGIAKATTDQRLTDKTVFTAFEQFIGTPAYMSPEQAEITSLDVDTRSDIYSLGVLLYELLTGKTPFDPAELLKIGLNEMRRTIREKEPARPSTRVGTLGADELTTTAKRRGLEPPKLANVLRGDLDWIVMKCLEKDRIGRYETANALAMDIQRHLSNEPVIACPPNKLYRLRKIVLRNKLAFAAAAAVGLSVLFGLGVSIWMYVQERGARLEQDRLRQEAETARWSEAQQRESAQANEAKARGEAAKSAQFAEFLKEVLKGVDPTKALGRDTTLLREILDNTVKRVGTELTNQPDVQMKLLTTLGETYGDLLEVKQMEAVAREALAIRRSNLLDEDLVTAKALAQLGFALGAQGGPMDEAKQYLTRALEIRKKLAGSESIEVADTLRDLGVMLCSAGQEAQAEEAAKEALRLYRMLLGDKHEEVANSYSQLGYVLKSRNKLPEADIAYRQALAIHREVFGKRHPYVAQDLSHLARIQSNPVEAERLEREVLAMWKTFFGDDHLLVAGSLLHLGEILAQKGELAEAEQAYRESVNLFKRHIQDASRDILYVMAEFARFLEQRGKRSEAQAVLSDALAVRGKLSAAAVDSLEMAGGLNELGTALEEEKRFQDAEGPRREALTIRQKLLSEDNPEVLASMHNLACTLNWEGKPVEAEAIERDVVKRATKAPNAKDHLPDYFYGLGLFLWNQGKLAEGEKLLRDSLAMRKERLGEANPDVENNVYFLAKILREEGQLAECEALLRQSLAMQRAGQGYPPAHLAETTAELAIVLKAQGKVPMEDPGRQTTINPNQNE